jgi:hypothetical protein
VNAGFPFNPARNFGLQLAAWAVGYPRSLVFFGSEWTYVLFPLLGALLGRVAYEALVKLHHTPEAPYLWTARCAERQKLVRDSSDHALPEAALTLPNAAAAMDVSMSTTNRSARSTASSAAGGGSYTSLLHRTPPNAAASPLQHSSSTSSSTQLLQVGADAQPGAGIAPAAAAPAAAPPVGYAMLAGSRTGSRADMMGNPVPTQTAANVVRPPMMHDFLYETDG